MIFKQTIKYLYYTGGSIKCTGLKLFRLYYHSGMSKSKVPLCLIYLKNPDRCQKSMKSAVLYDLKQINLNNCYPYKLVSQLVLFETTNQHSYFLQAFHTNIAHNLREMLSLIQTFSFGLNNSRDEQFLTSGGRLDHSREL